MRSGAQGQTPGYAAEPAAGPTVEQLPAAPQQSWHDLVVEANADNNRKLANQRYAANPALRNPNQLAGSRGPGGVGLWGYPDQPRTEGPGADFQEQISGNPWGLEINLGGTPTTTAAGVQTAEGGKWFDDVRVDASSGQMTLVDAKHWNGFVLPRVKFWEDEVVSAASGELKALEDAGLAGRGKIEWPVSTKDAADEIRKVIDRELSADQANRVTVVVVPKKGP